ncbi:MAG: hypothetical protein NC343_03845 [Muribaculum sp.]|nr:hypothetical protein [Muribaculaceae bacterium]MCM1080862.1 hypothetical protein [Muribaculum sp.]
MRQKDEVLQAQLTLVDLQRIMKADSERNQAAVAKLFRRQFEIVDKFAAMRYECEDERKLAVNYGREAIKLVKSLEPNTVELTELEQYINEHYDNLISKLDSAFSQLSNMERNIFMYAVIGLSPRAMSVLLNLPIDSIYNRKSRLKTKLKSGPEELKFIFDKI